MQRAWGTVAPGQRWSQAVKGVYSTDGSEWRHFVSLLGLGCLEEECLILKNNSEHFWVVVICWGPAWGSPPMAKVMRKEAWHTQRRDQASGKPLLPSIYPETRVCFILLPTPLTLRGALPSSPFLSEKELTCSSKSIKIPGHDKSVSAYRLLWRLSSPPV